MASSSRSRPPLQRADAGLRDNRVAWTYYFEIVLPLLALALLVLSRDGFRPLWPHAVPKIAIVGLLGVILDAGFLRSPLAARLADPSVPHAIVIAWPTSVNPFRCSSRILIPPTRLPAAGSSTTGSASRSS